MDRALLQAGDLGCVDGVPRPARPVPPGERGAARALTGFVAMDQFTRLTHSRLFPSAVGARHGRMFAGIRRQAADLPPTRSLTEHAHWGYVCLELFVQVYVEGHCVGHAASWGCPFVRMQMA